MPILLNVGHPVEGVGVKSPKGSESPRVRAEDPEPEPGFDFTEEGVRMNITEESRDGNIWPTGVTNPANPVSAAVPDRKCPISVVREDARQDRFLCRQNDTGVLKWITGRDLDRKGLRVAFVESTDIVTKSET